MGKSTNQSSYRSSAYRSVLPSGTRLSKGSRGEHVKSLQKAIGVKPDGVFGPFTFEALKRWQLSKGLVVTGVLDEATLKALR